MTAEYTRWVQSSLNQILGTRLAVDAQMGQQTRSAIRSFQQRAGITVDGKIGAQTEKALLAAGAPPPPGSGAGGASANVIDARIDAGAQKAILRMRSGDLSARADAAAMLAAVKTGQLAGIFGDDLKAAADLAKTLNTGRWELVPKGEDATLVRSGGAVAIAFREQIRSDAVRLDAALRKAFAKLRSNGGGGGPKRPAPLRPEELEQALKPRSALKSAAGMPIEVSMVMPGIAQPRVNTSLVKLASSGLSDAPAPFEVKFLIDRALGIHAIPPPIKVNAVEPPRDIKLSQQMFLSLDGRVPDHLAFRPTPARLPAELTSRPRIQVRLSKERHRDIHEPTTIFKPDERDIFKDATFPWCTIGRVETPGSGPFSGVMVGPRHLLTCSHGMQWNSNNIAGWVKFTPAYFDGSTPFGVAWGTTIYSEVKVNGSDGIDRNEGQHDYVVVVLGSRIGDLTGWMGARGWSDDWDNEPYWHHAGYPADLTSGERPTYQRKIPMDGSFWDREVHTRIFHKGDVFPGQSGGPFFAWWSGEPWPRVVAVQSGQTDDENSASGGAHMVDLISRARKEFP